MNKLTTLSLLALLGVAVSFNVVADNHGGEHEVNMMNDHESSDWNDDTTEGDMMGDSAMGDNDNADNGEAEHMMEEGMMPEGDMMEDDSETYESETN